MNYKKVIKDLKERNDKLQEQYRLRDIRCIHLEYENEMLTGDFEAQHELTKKYAEENQELKKRLEENRLNHKQLKDLDKIENSFIKIKNQQKEFIEYLENEIKIYSNTYMGEMLKELKEILSKYKEIIGNNE